VYRACSAHHRHSPGLRCPARLQLLAEIKIHRSLSHRYVVGFESFFEDRHNVYIMLELCGNQVRHAGRTAGARRR
jgi:serine/threonine protein kinase